MESRSSTRSDVLSGRRVRVRCFSHVLDVEAVLLDQLVQVDRRRRPPAPSDRWGPCETLVEVCYGADRASTSRLMLGEAQVT